MTKDWPSFYIYYNEQIVAFYPEFQEIIDASWVIPNPGRWQNLKKWIESNFNCEIVMENGAFEKIIFKDEDWLLFTLMMGK